MALIGLCGRTTVSREHIIAFFVMLACRAHEMKRATREL